MLFQERISLLGTLAQPFIVVSRFLANGPSEPSAACAEERFISQPKWCLRGQTFTVRGFFHRMNGNELRELWSLAFPVERFFTG